MKTKNLIKLKMYASLCLFIFFLSNAQAQENDKRSESDSTNLIIKYRNTINVCPGGIAFGFYSANIEHLFGNNHGIVLRGDLETIPKTYSDAHIDANGRAVVLNYRYHIGGGLNSYYAGAYGRYRMIKGEGTLESGEFDFTMPEYTIGLNVGKRWIWKSGFTLNLALGYGYTHEKLDVNNSSQEAIDAIDVFRNDYAFMNGFLGEFSIGYAF